MHGTYVPFPARSRQIPLVVIAVFSCGLSFWLTVRFCASLAPGHAALELLAIGVTWELAKMTFSTIGSHRTQCVDAGERAAGYALLGVSLVLAVGSIVASLAFLVQTDHRIGQDAAQASQQALHASKAYERDTSSLHSLDGEVTQLMALAQEYRANGMVTQSVRTLERIHPLREARMAQARALAAQEATITSSSPAAAAGVLLGASSTWRLASQGVLAVMLEVVSMMAMGLLFGRQSGAMKAGSASPTRPTPNVVHLKVASPCITRDTNPCKLASNSALDDGDTMHQAPLSHRLAVDAPFSRITCDAGLHQTASGAAVDNSSISRPVAGTHHIPCDVAPMRITGDAFAQHPVSHRMNPGAALNAPADAVRGGRDAQRLCSLYAHAKRLVCSAQVRPSYRQMRQALGASQPVVQRFLRELVAEGVLYRSGMRYALVSALDMTGGEA
jgi:hypothetical protein